MGLRALHFPYQPQLPYPFLLQKPNRPAIFIHIPKTGGTSIHRALQLPLPDKSKKLAKHYTAGVIKNHLPDNLWEEAYKFAFVRNPYERLYSHYQYRFKQQKILRNHGQQLGFADWVKAVLPAIKPNNLQAQYKWLCNTDGELIIDVVGKFEQLSTDFQQICQQLNLPSTTLPHLNKSTKQGEYLKQYDDESFAIATDFYQEDLRLFNYNFG